MVYKSVQIFLPFCHNPRVWQTDGRTDRILITIPRLHYMQRGKNYADCHRGKVIRTVLCCIVYWSWAQSYAVLTVLWIGFCHTGPISLCI